MPDNPRIGGGPQGHRTTVAVYCERCGVQYRFAAPKTEDKE
jgi:hypothetical protein